MQETSEWDEKVSGPFWKASRSLILILDLFSCETGLILARRIALEVNKADP